MGRRPSAARGKGTRRPAWDRGKPGPGRARGGRACPGGREERGEGARRCVCPVRQAAPHGASCTPVLGKPLLAEGVKSALGPGPSLDTGRGGDGGPLERGAGLPAATPLRGGRRDHPRWAA